MPCVGVRTEVMGGRLWPAGCGQFLAEIDCSAGDLPCRPERPVLSTFFAEIDCAAMDLPRPVLVAGCCLVVIGIAI